MRTDVLRKKFCSNLVSSAIQKFRVSDFRLSFDLQNWLTNWFTKLVLVQLTKKLESTFGYEPFYATMITCNLRTRLERILLLCSATLKWKADVSTTITYYFNFMSRDWYSCEDRANLMKTLIRLCRKRTLFVSAPENFSLFRGVFQTKRCSSRPKGFFSSWPWYSL